jgi:hypothetical protein
MHTIANDNETALESGRGTWDNEGGSAEPVEDASLEGTTAALVSEPFPAVLAGSEVLRDRELVRLVDTGTLGKYRVQPRGLGQAGPAFLVTLYGATCSKISLRGFRRLGWPDYVVAMKRAIEREVGYWQNRGELLPRARDRAVEVTVRESDFVESGALEEFGVSPRPRT